MFPDVVKAVCQAYTVKTDACPNVETSVLNNNAQLIESKINDSEGFTSVGSTELSGVDWAKEQASDETLNRVIKLLIRGYFPHKNEQRVETPEVSRYFREWTKLEVANHILYRISLPDGQETSQLVVPTSFRTTVLKHLHDDFGHQGRDRTLSLVRSRFFGPV